MIARGVRQALRVETRSFRFGAVATEFIPQSGKTVRAPREAPYEPRSLLVPPPFVAPAGGGPPQGRVGDRAPAGGAPAIRRLWDEPATADSPVVIALVRREQLPHYDLPATIDDFLALPAAAGERA